MSKSIHLFDNMNNDEVETILSSLPLRKYKKNHILIFEDDPINRVYIVKSGTLKVYRTYEDKEIIMDFVGKGEILGEVELFSKTPALSSAEVIEDAEIYHLSQESFTKLLYKKKPVLENIFRIHHHRFKTLNKQIQNLTFYSVYTRVCRVLLDFLDKNDNESNLVVKNINQSTLASMVGATRESVSKSFKDLQDEHIILLKPNTIQIIDLKKLKYYAGVE